MIVIAYDMKLRRPGCALLQAVYGGTIDNYDLQKMLDHWLLAPTDDLKPYIVRDQNQLEQIIKMTNEFNKTRNRHE